MRTALLFAAFIVALVLLNWIGAWMFGAIGYIAQYWLEYFASRDMEELAVVAALVIFVGGFFGIIFGIVKVEDWWRLRKIRRLRSL